MRRRSGLTLVEMLVALALSVLIMAILSEAFAKGLQAFRQLKALGDMEQQLRTAATLLRRDLRAAHFEGNRKLSQLTASGRSVPNFTAVPPGAYPGLFPTATQLAPFTMVSPDQGFFRINENLHSTPELASTISPVPTHNYVDNDDELQMTVRLAGNSRDEMFFGSVPRNRVPGALMDWQSGLPHTRFDHAFTNDTYASQWAEVAYFLNVDTNRAFGVVDVNQQTRMPTYFNLYRRQLLLLPDAFAGQLPQVVPTAGTGDTYTTPVQAGAAQDAAFNAAAYYADYDISAWQVLNSLGNYTYVFNTPSDVQFPFRRFNHRHLTGVNTGRLVPILGPRQGSDLLLTNVISFDVKVLDPIATPIAARPVDYADALVNPPPIPNPPSADYPWQRGPYYKANSDPGSLNRFVDIGGSYVSPAISPANPLLRGAYPPALWSNAPGPVPPAWLTAVVPGDAFNYRTFFETGTNRIEYFAGLGGIVNPQNPANAILRPSHSLPFAVIQITIRVHDPKTKQTRQATILLDM